MKIAVNKFSVILCIMLLTALGSYAQTFSVRVRPHRPAVVAVRPPRPSVRHVWVEEEWRPAGRRYVYHGGYWAAPPRHRAHWVPGHWTRNVHGWHWVPGHWR